MKFHRHNWDFPYAPDKEGRVRKCGCGDKQKAVYFANHYDVFGEHYLEWYSITSCSESGEE